MIAPHHDGSPLYVSNSAPTIGDVITLRMCTSASERPQGVLVRTVRDGEPHNVVAELESVDGDCAWWRADLPIRNTITRYRWLLHGGAFSYSWLTAQGLVHHDVPDATDFIVVAGEEVPAWANSAVVYQIFPDRFARGSDREQLGVAEPRASLPEWAQPRAWTDPVEGRGPATPFEFFGGDLVGVREHVDHIQALGANVVYMTPIFPAGSTHRYDASSFDSIDPLLGGDDALQDLIGDVHSRGMRVMGDITLNHCGRGHRWFLAAQEGQQPERSYFRFDPATDHGYETWLGVPSLPKFDYSTGELATALISEPQAPVRKWLAGEEGLDGWRVDVANMAGRLASDDLAHDVARETRRAMAKENPLSLLVAEHNHDASEDLLGDGWHGTMNYAGFTRPVWSWLKSPDFNEPFFGLPVPIPQFTGVQMVNTMRAFQARMPWRSLLASWNILGSHDTARIRSVVGSRERQEAALALCIGLPGVPMVFAGDEIGSLGMWGEDSRTPFPWHDTDAWDHEIYASYRTLLTLRASSTALALGGMRWLHVSDDAVAFVRELPDESIVAVVARGQSESLRIPLASLMGTRLEHLFGFSCHVEAEQCIVEVPHAGAGLWRLT